MNEYLRTTEFAQAEREADQLMGDTLGSYAVVEDFSTGYFLVLKLTDAQQYADAYDAEIQYQAVPVTG